MLNHIASPSTRPKLQVLQEEITGPHSFLSPWQGGKDTEGLTHVSNGVDIIGTHQTLNPENRATAFFFLSSHKASKLIQKNDHRLYCKENFDEIQTGRNHRQHFDHNVIKLEN